MAKITSPSRAPGLSPIQCLMDSLYDLYYRLSHTGGNEKAMSVIEAHEHFSTEGDKRKICVYAIKSQSLFRKQDYEAVKELLLKVLDEVRKIEGEDFGR